MGGSHCDSRPCPLSGQVAIFWIAAWPQETNVHVLVARRPPSRQQLWSAYVDLHTATVQYCTVSKNFRPRPRAPSLLHQTHVQHRRAMAQMCYIEKWKLADVLDVPRRTTPAPSQHQGRGQPIHGGGREIRFPPSREAGDHRMGASKRMAWRNHEGGADRNRVACDLAYIENLSLWFDLRIMVLTITRELLSRHAF